MNRNGFHRFDDFGWKNSHNSLENPEKRCPICGNLKKRSSTLCNTCSHDKEKNREYERQFTKSFRQMILEQRRQQEQEQHG